MRFGRKKEKDDQRTLSRTIQGKPVTGVDMSWQPLDTTLLCTCHFCGARVLWCDTSTSSLLENVRGFWYLGQKSSHVQPWIWEPGSDPLTSISPDPIRICKCLIPWKKKNPFLPGPSPLFFKLTPEWCKVELHVLFCFISAFPQGSFPVVHCLYDITSCKVHPLFGKNEWNRLTLRESPQDLKIFNIWKKLW